MKYVVHATQTKEFEVPVEALNAAEALEKVQNWIQDDFEEFQTHAEWSMDVGNTFRQGVSHMIRPPLRALDEAEAQ